MNRELIGVDSLIKHGVEDLGSNYIYKLSRHVCRYSYHISRYSHRFFIVSYFSFSILYHDFLISLCFLTFYMFWKKFSISMDVSILYLYHVLQYILGCIKSHKFIPYRKFNLD